MLRLDWSIDIRQTVGQLPVLSEKQFRIFRFLWRRHFSSLLPHSSSSSPRRSAQSQSQNSQNGYSSNQSRHVCLLFPRIAHRNVRMARAIRFESAIAALLCESRSSPNFVSPLAQRYTPLLLL